MPAQFPSAPTMWPPSGWPQGSRSSASSRFPRCRATARCAGCGHRRPYWRSSCAHGGSGRPGLRRSCMNPRRFTRLGEAGLPDTSGDADRRASARGRCADTAQSPRCPSGGAPCSREYRSSPSCSAGAKGAFAILFLRPTHHLHRLAGRRHGDPKWPADADERARRFRRSPSCDVDRRIVRMDGSCKKNPPGSFRLPGRMQDCVKPPRHAGHTRPPWRYAP